MSSTNRSIGIKPFDQITSAFSWALFNLNEGGGDGAGTATKVTNDSRASVLADFNVDTGITTQWSARNGFFDNLGSSSISQLRTADATAMDAVFDCGDGCMLIALQVMGRTSTGRSSLIHIGGASGAQQYGIWMFKETSNRPAFLLRDDNNNQGTIQYLGTSTPVTFDGSRTFNLFLLVDNRAGVKTATGYGQDATSIDQGVSAGTATDLTALGSLPLNSAKGNAAVYFGRRGGSTPNRLNGQIRRCFVMNFGQDKPANVTDIINDLHQNGLVPTFTLP